MQQDVEQLVDLNLRNNNIEDFPTEMRYLSNLIEIRLNNNQITSYALNRLLRTNNSLILYQLGLSEEGDSTLLSQSIKFPLPFHYEPLNKNRPKMNNHAPRGWSIKIQSTFTPLPSTDEVFKNKIHYRTWLNKLVRLRDEISYAHSGLLMEQNKNAFDDDDNYALTKKERDIIHKKALLP